jgi:hypothetical protein
MGGARAAAGFVAGIGDEARGRADAVLVTYAKINDDMIRADEEGADSFPASASGSTSRISMRRRRKHRRSTKVP